MIEDTRTSFCGNSYHQLSLGANEYWEFAAPVYTVPALVKALKLKGSRAAEVLGEFGADANAAVPALLDFVKSARGHDRVEAAFALWKIESKAEPAVPILIEEVRSGQAYGAARRLGEIGVPPKAAIPDLTRVLKNDDYGLIAARALWKITQQPEPALSTAIRALQERDAYRNSWTAIQILEEMGSQAKPAVLVLLEVHRWARLNEHDSLREEIANALTKIDAAAAKKAGTGASRQARPAGETGDRDAPTDHDGRIPLERPQTSP
jgi:HEAT repeat protein